MSSKKRLKSNAPAVKSRGRRRPKAKIPDLRAILNALAVASALVAVSLAALKENDCVGHETTVLRLGLEGLDAVYDQLDAAHVQLARFRSKGGGS